MTAGDDIRLAVLHGDGIGPEVMPPTVDAAVAALRSVGGPVPRLVELPMGLSAIDGHGSPLPDSTIEQLADVDGWLLGPHDSVAYPPPHDGILNPSGTLRTHFDLFANIRPARTMAGVPAVVTDVDLVIVRENTQGFYADRNTHRGTGEFMPTPDTAIAMGVFTRSGVERVVRLAFDLARNRRRRLTVVHKANVLRLTTGMFREVCAEVGEEYPDVELDDHHVDAMAAHLVRRPADFDVIVTENMFGDILSDLAGELTGSLGMAPSINTSLDRAMAQATHGSAPDIAGRGEANPTGMMLSTAMLFDWLGVRRGDDRLAQAARVLRAGVETVVATGPTTPDLGGTASTTGFGRAVVEAVEAASLT